MITIKFISEYTEQEIAVSSEKKIFKELKNSKMGITVLYSYPISEHKTQPEGEADFIVICERGIACLEVKGGRVSAKENKTTKIENGTKIEANKPEWFSVDRDGNSHEIKNPYQQAEVNMRSLQSIIEGKYPNKYKGILYAYGVLFPDNEYFQKVYQRPEELCYTKRTKDITEFLNKLFDYQQKRVNKDIIKLGNKDIEKISEYLLGIKFADTPMLRDELESIERKIVKLTDEQCGLIKILDESQNPRLLVWGAPGSGKTLIALDYAMNQAGQGKEVLYIIYNKTLLDNFNELVDKEMVRKGVSEQRNHLKIDTMESVYNSKETKKYDVLVIDEGQDIKNEEYILCFEEWLKGGFKEGNWAFFYGGQQQNLYKCAIEDVLKYLEANSSPVKWQLKKNCRNTAKIGEYAEHLSGYNSGELVGDQGEDVREISYKHDNDSDFEKKIRAILNELKKEKVPLESVVFLSGNKYENSKLCKCGIEVNDIKQPIRKGVPGFSTIHSFKGLDSEVVILCDLSGIGGREECSELFCVAATRARGLLYVVGSDRFWSKQPMKGEEYKL